jgi:hypothetical protein
MRNIFILLALFGMICSWVLPDNQVDERKKEAAERFCTYFLANKVRDVCNGSYFYAYSKRNAASIQELQAQGTAVNPGQTFCR